MRGESVVGCWFDNGTSDLNCDEGTSSIGGSLISITALGKPQLLVFIKSSLFFCSVSKRLKAGSASCSPACY